MAMCKQNAPLVVADFLKEPNNLFGNRHKLENIEAECLIFEPIGHVHIYDLDKSCDVTKDDPCKN